MHKKTSWDIQNVCFYRKIKKNISRDIQEWSGWGGEGKGGGLTYEHKNTARSVVYGCLRLNAHITVHHHQWMQDEDSSRSLGD